MRTSTLLHFHSPVLPVDAHSFPRTGTSTGYEGAEGRILISMRAPFFHLRSRHPLFLALSSLFPRAQLYTLLLDHDPPSFVPPRFALPFVILALVVYPSAPLSPVLLRTSTPAPSHLHATRTALPSTYPTLPCSFPVLLPSPLRLQPAASGAPCGTTGLHYLQRRLFLCHHYPRPRGASSHSTNLTTPPEAQAQHYEVYDARSVLKHHCTIDPFSAATLLTLYKHEIDASMRDPRDRGVLLAVPRRPGAVRRRGMWLCLATIILRLSFIALIFCCDVLRIRPVVLITPSLVAEPPSRVPRRLCLRCDQMIFVTHLFFLCSNFFARRSPLEPIPSLQVLTVHGNALGVLAGCRLIFRPQTILNRRQCISSWRGRFRFSPLALVAHMSLYHSFLFSHPDISPLVSYILYMNLLCPPVLGVPIHNV
ncbi:hypothetical protein C8J57DRAFT_1718485 [Mycena rebaudengoi]|nr:hypothetical protein C8J57DRAFT_1718485 [Mycena rebaudengoi]